jgi:hypothetical protein
MDAFLVVLRSERQLHEQRNMLRAAAAAIHSTIANAVRSSTSQSACASARIYIYIAAVTEMDLMQLYPFSFFNENDEER